MQLKSVVENELTSAAISAQGKNLLFSPFPRFSFIFISLIGEVTKLLFLICLPPKVWQPCPPSPLPWSSQGVTLRAGGEGGGHGAMAEPCNCAPTRRGRQAKLSWGLYFVLGSDALPKAVVLPGELWGRRAAVAAG